MNGFVKAWSGKRVLKRGRLTSCLILIALVMAPLVCALIFSDSMMEGITNKYIHLSDGHLHVEGATREDFDSSAIQGMVTSIDEVTGGFALMYSASGTCSVMIKGVEGSYFNQSRMSQITIETLPSAEGAQISESRLKGIVISRPTAKALGVELGDRVALMIVPDDPDKVLRPVLVRVEGIFHSGYDQLDRLLAFMDIDYAKTLYASPSSTGLEILVDSGHVGDLDSVIGAMGNTYSVSKWNERNVSVYENFVTSRQMIFIVLLLVASVAAFYTASVAQQMVQDDIQDIAIAKLIGCPNNLVRRAAFISVYVVTIAGLVIGVILGLLIGCNLGPILTWLSDMGIDSLSFYLLDFSISVPGLQILVISASLLAISAVAVNLSLSRTREITPMRLFTSL